MFILVDGDLVFRIGWVYQYVLNFLFVMFILDLKKMVILLDVEFIIGLFELL